MDINPFSDIRIAGIFFLFTLLIVSFINSVLKTGSPGHVAGEVQERDLNLAILEPGRLTRVLSFLAGASALLIFMIPHHQPLTYRTLWDPGGIWAVVMCRWVQEPIHGIEKVSPHLQGKVLRGGADPGHPAECPTRRIPLSEGRPRGLLGGHGQAALGMALTLCPLGRTLDLNPWPVFPGRGPLVETRPP